VTLLCLPDMVFQLSITWRCDGSDALKVPRQWDIHHPNGRKSSALCRSAAREGPRSIAG